MIDAFGGSHSLKETYTFAEVSSVTSIKPYVLRFWETEFTEISPLIQADGEKIYSKENLEFILLVKNLLFEKKMSIPEAKAYVAKGDIGQTINQMDTIVEDSSISTSIEAKSESNLNLASSKLKEILKEIDSLSEIHGWNI